MLLVENPLGVGQVDLVLGLLSSTAG